MTKDQVCSLLRIKNHQRIRLPVSKRVRFIIGTDEESGWKRMDRYFQTGEIARTLVFTRRNIPNHHVVKKEFFHYTAIFLGERKVTTNYCFDAGLRETWFLKMFMRKSLFQMQMK